jgi:hypothetical protein
MRILEQVLFALTFVFFVIGIHQTTVYGFLNSYFIFTFAVSTFLGYGYVKNNRLAKEKDAQKATEDSQKKK